MNRVDARVIVTVLMIVLGFGLFQAAKLRGERHAKSLFAAASEGDIVALEAHVAQREPLDVLDEFGQTPIIASIGHEKATRYLLQHGASPNLSTTSGSRPLQVAVSKSDRETVKILLDHGAEIDLKDLAGETALLAAIRTENYEIADDLLDRHANPDVPDNFGRSPLHFAAATGNLDAIRRLLREGAKPERVSRFGATPLGVAILNGRRDAYDLLVGLSPKDAGRLSPLHCAALAGAMPAQFELLIQPLLPPESPALQRLKGEYGPADPDAESQADWFVRDLVKRGYPVASKGPRGYTPLHMAAISGQTVAAMALLDCGADPSVEDGNGETPLAAARKANVRQMVELLGGSPKGKEPKAAAPATRSTSR